MDVVAHKHDIGLFSREGGDGFDINHFGYIPAAVANIYADSHLLVLLHCERVASTVETPDLSGPPQTGPPGSGRCPAVFPCKVRFQKDALRALFNKESPGASHSVPIAPRGDENMA